MVFAVVRLPSEVGDSPTTRRGRRCASGVPGRRPPRSSRDAGRQGPPPKLSKRQWLNVGLVVLWPAEGVQVTLVIVDGVRRARGLRRSCARSRSSCRLPGCVTRRAGDHRPVGPAHGAHRGTAAGAGFLAGLLRASTSRSRCSPRTPTGRSSSHDLTERAARSSAVRAVSTCRSDPGPDGHDRGQASTSLRRNDHHAIRQNPITNGQRLDSPDHMSSGIAVRPEQARPRVE